MSKTWYCGEDDEALGCGEALKIVRELESPAAQVVYFEARCPECKLRWEVWHDLEAEVSGSELIVSADNEAE